MNKEGKLGFCYIKQQVKLQIVFTVFQVGWRSANAGSKRLTLHQILLRLSLQADIYLPFRQVGI